MAPRTPRQNMTAGPFVTLLLSKNGAPNPAQSMLDDTTSASTSPIISVHKDKKGSSKRSAKKRGLNSDRDLEIMASTPTGPHQRHSQTTSPTTSLLENGLPPFKYSTPSTSQAVSQEDEIDFTKSLEKSSQSLTHSATKDFPNFLDGQMDRRSSTASLTDNGTRSSGRARKLTSKAQALAGTKFLPSLQASPEIEVASERINNSTAGEQVSHIAEDLLPNTPLSETHETAMIETPMESVEVAAVRTSARERKPTARAAESETVRSSRKRPASPASPVGSERASKFPKKSPSALSKPSKLRHSAVNLEETTSNGSVTIVEESDLNPSAAANCGMDQPNGKSPDKAAHKDVDTDDTVAQTELPTLSAEVVMADNIEKSETPQCNLRCLSPSSRLLAFAKFVAEVSDSDSDSDDNLEDEMDLDTTADSLESSNALSERASHIYCQCRSNKLEVKPSAIPGESVPQSLAEPIEATSEHNSNHEPIVSAAIPKSVMRSSDIRPVQTNVARPDKKTKSTASKRHKANDKKPDLKRQDSSFERRMQTDYLATLREKAVGLHDDSKQFALAVPPKERRKTLPPKPNTNSSPRILRHRASNIDLANGFKPGSVDVGFADQILDDHAKVPNNHSFVTLKIMKRDALPAKRPMNEYHTNLDSSLLDEREKSVSTGNANQETKVTDVVLPEDKKPASKGTVRASLRDSGGDKASKINANADIPTPPAKSIKLRFTTTAR